MSKPKISSNIDKVKKDIKDWKKKASNSFHKDLGLAVIDERVKLQKKINSRIDRPTKFTQKAVNSYNRIRSSGKTSFHSVFIMNNQEKYLKYYFEGGSNIEKFVPVTDDRTNQFGNIPQLKNGKKIGKYVTTKSKSGKILLLDPSVKAGMKNKKKLGKRLVAVLKTTDRSNIMGSWKENENEMKKNIQKRMKKHFIGKINFV
ncbi:TPA: hypothetical protein ACSV9R_004146 [Escherichia coli]|uniref:hypothetical protein n=1 Tax=Escherichia coli TaxID=562 RepID=UPI0015FAE5E3|nr:hypothetical protein [Escherichia coli]DAJ58478.1 MAG TPA: hypothetical protein [Caudoviricetes sp.]EEZ4486198.1 hypothetical protein [Escherichia coli]EFF7976183.1 hypothetical protein [Escherichia coli]EFH8474789.1 hypothetical protein [Escherichia coli]EFN9956274.1 hypothetical protein [Escherichia coli]